MVFLQYLFYNKYFFLETEFLYVVFAVLDLFCRPGLHDAQRSASLCLLNAGIERLCHHTGHNKYYIKVYV